MLVYLDSGDSLELHPDNTPTSFTVQMPDSLINEHYQSPNGRWFLTLLDLTVPPLSSKLDKWDIVYVTCQQVVSSVRGANYEPILRAFTAGEIKRHNFVRFPSLIYLPVKRAELKTFTITLTDGRGKIVECPDKKLDQRSTKCTLELSWRSNVINPYP